MDVALADKNGCGGLHSLPSKLDSTGPRKYISLRGGVGPSKRTRRATLSSSARLAIVPTCMLLDRPVRAAMASLGTPHRGAMRGKSKNRATMIGAPSRAIQLAILAACMSGGRPTGMWLLTKAVSRPSMPISMASAVSRLCEKKKLLSKVKKPRKKITNVSRWPRISKVLRLSKTTIYVTPASRPTSVRWVK